MRMADVQTLNEGYIGVGSWGIRKRLRMNHGAARLMDC